MYKFEKSRNQQKLWTGSANSTNYDQKLKERCARQTQMTNMDRQRYNSTNFTNYTGKDKQFIQSNQTQSQGQQFMNDQPMNYASLYQNLPTGHAISANEFASLIRENKGGNIVCHSELQHHQVKDSAATLDNSFEHSKSNAFLDNSNQSLNFNSTQGLLMTHKIPKVFNQSSEKSRKLLIHKNSRAVDSQSKMKLLDNQTITIQDALDRYDVYDESKKQDQLPDADHLNDLTKRTTNTSKSKKFEPYFTQHAPSQKLLTTYHEAIQDQRFGVLRPTSLEFNLQQHENQMIARNKPQSHQINNRKIMNQNGAYLKLAQNKKLKSNYVSGRNSVVKSLEEQSDENVITQQSLKKILEPNPWHQNVNYKNQYTKAILNVNQMPEVNEILLANQMFEDEQVKQCQNVKGLLARQSQQFNMNMQVKKSMVAQPNDKLKVMDQYKSKSSQQIRRNATSEMQKAFNTQFEKKSQFFHEKQSMNSQDASSKSLNRIGSKQDFEEQRKIQKIRDIVNNDLTSLSSVKIKQSLQKQNAKGNMNNSQYLSASLSQIIQKDSENQNILSQPMGSDYQKIGNILQKSKALKLNSLKQSTRQNFWSKRDNPVEQQQKIFSKDQIYSELSIKNSKTPVGFSHSQKCHLDLKAQAAYQQDFLKDSNQIEKLMTSVGDFSTYNRSQISSSQLNLRNIQKPHTTSGERLYQNINKYQLNQPTLKHINTKAVNQQKVNLPIIEDSEVKIINNNVDIQDMKNEQDAQVDDINIVSDEEQKRIQFELDQLARNLKKKEAEIIKSEHQLKMKANYNQKPKTKVEVNQLAQKEIRYQNDSNLNQPAFPLKQDFVVFEPKISLVSKEESKKFQQRIDEITGVNPDDESQQQKKMADYTFKQTLLHIDKESFKKTSKRVHQFRIEQQDKVWQLEAELDELINEIKTEYLDKNLASKSLEQMDFQIVDKYRQIISQENEQYNLFIKLSDRLKVPSIKAQEKQQILDQMKHIKHFLRRNSVVSGRVPTDYEIYILKQGDQGHFYDHKGNFITCTGHMVDDYANPDNKKQPPRKLKTRSDSVSAKNDISRKFFPSREEIFANVKKQEKIHVDIEKMKMNTKNQMYTDIFMENVEKVRQESIERKKGELLLNQNISPDLYTNNGQYDNGLQDGIRSPHALDTEYSALDGDHLFVGSQQHRCHSFDSNSSFDDSENLIEDDLALDFTFKIDKLQQKIQAKKNNIFLRKFKQFNQDSENIEVKDALHLLGGPWDGLYLEQFIDPDEQIVHPEQVQDIMKAHSLVIKENVDLGIMFKKLESFCSGKRLVQINRKLNDMQLASILHKLFELSPNLYKLEINNCQIGNECTQILVRLFKYHQDKSVQNLRVFGLVNCKLQNTMFIELLSSLYRFREFRMDDTFSADLSHLIPTKKQSTSVNVQSKQEAVNKIDPQPQQPLTFLALEYLNLEGMQMTNEHLKFVVQLLNHSKSITRLNLSYNRMNPQGLEPLLDKILQIDQIKYLNLSHLNMSSERCQKLLEAIAEHCWSTTSLNISYTQIKEPIDFLKYVKLNAASLQCLHFEGNINNEQIPFACSIMDPSLDNRTVLGDIDDRIPIQTEHMGSLSPHPHRQTSIKNIETEVCQQIQYVDQRSQSPSRRNFPRTIKPREDITQSLVFYNMLGHSELFRSNNWRCSLNNQSCPHCDNYRLCLILHYTPISESYNPQIVIDQRTVTKMVRLEEFCSSISEINKDNRNWLVWIKQSLRSKRPKILISKRSDKSGLNKQCWISIDYFKPNTVHFIEINNYDRNSQNKEEISKMQFTVRDTGLIQTSQNIGCLNKQTFLNKLNQSEEEEPETNDQKNEKKDKKKETKENKKTIAIDVPLDAASYQLMPIVNQVISMDTSKYELQFLNPLQKNKFYVNCTLCIDTDYDSSKISVVVDKVNQMEAIRETLRKNKVFLVDLFKYLQAKSNFTEKLYPKVSKFTVLDFLRDFGILENPRVQDTIDEILLKSMQSRLQMRNDDESPTITRRKSKQLDASLTKFTQTISKIGSRTNSRSIGRFDTQQSFVTQSGPGFKRFQIIEILCRIALQKNLLTDDDSNDDGSKSAETSEDVLIQQFFEEKLLPQWSKMNSYDIRLKLYFTPQNDLMLLHHKKTIQQLIELILQGIGKQVNTSKLDVPLLAILKYFLSMTNQKKEFANISALNKGKLPSLKEVVEDEEDSFLSQCFSERSSPQKPAGVGKNSDDGRYMRCQLQKLTNIDPQDIFECFILSKDPLPDENLDEQQTAFVEQQMTLRKEMTFSESSHSASNLNLRQARHNSMIYQPSNTQNISYQKCYPLTSEHHTLIGCEFYEFLIRFAPKLVFAEKYKLCENDRQNWSSFYALDRFFELIKLKIKYESLK